MPSDTIKQLRSIQPEQFSDDFERFEALEAARGLVARLETPFERAWSLAAEPPVSVAGLITFKNLGVWTRWAEHEKDKGPGVRVSLADILSWCNAKAEPNTLRRLLRYLAATSIVNEVDVDTWRSTPFSLGLGGEIGRIVQVAVDHSYPTGVNLPKFLAKHGYAEPVDLTKFDNYTDVYGKPFWARCEKDPAAAESFTALMTSFTADKLDWTAVYDTDLLVSGADLSPRAPPLFVDVGGLHGMDTNRLLSRHPSLPSGLLFVQDLPEAIERQVQAELDKEAAAAKGLPCLDSRITRMPHDFYKPQPLVGARAYFLHAVLHDWPDAICIRILENIKGSMTRGYSKLLLYECVIPPKGATTLATTLDMCLMTMNSGLERTEAHWRKILESVGFKVVRIDRHRRAVESVIEAELA